MLRQIEELEAADAKRREVEEMMAQVAMQLSLTLTLTLTLTLALTSVQVAMQEPSNPSPTPNPSPSPNPNIGAGLDAGAALRGLRCLPARGRAAPAAGSGLRRHGGRLRALTLTPGSTLRSTHVRG